MSYKALYRTYRPQTFNEVKGQEVVVKTLQNAIINNKISHAYLFSGPRGTGKTSIARIFAKALNCGNVLEGEPCDKCISCEEISQGINPDVIEIDAASNNGVDEIRDIREKVKFLPSGSKYKIYIIDEVHMLSGGAFNALLKTLEEPPKHVIFILATTEPQKLPATIISRCQRFEFKSLSVAEISERLRTICELEDVVISEEALNSISESADGAMRDALSILDQAISYGSKNIEVEDINGVTGSLSFDKIFILASAIEKKDVHVTIEMINDLISSGKEISKIINSLLVFYRDVMLYKSVGNSGYTKYVFTKEQFQELSLNIPMSKIMYFVDVLSDIQNKVKNSTTPNVFLEIALIKMCNISVEELDLIKRVSELENKLNDLGTNNLVGENISTVDNEKVTILDARVNQIVSELNKLELRKQIERIDMLSQNANQNQANTSTEETKTLIQDLQNLKDKVEELDLFVNKDASVEIDEKVLSRIEALETRSDSNVNVKEFQERLQKLESKDQIIPEVNLDGIYKRLNDLENIDRSVNDGDIDLTNIYNRLQKIEENENSLDVDIVNKVEKLEEDMLNTLDDLSQIKVKLSSGRANIDFENRVEDFTEISDKLMFLEKRVYQIMAGELAAKKVVKKDVKKNKDQIMLFGEDLLSLSDYENKKEKFDFEELEKEERTIPEEKQEEVFESVKEETIINDSFKEELRETESKQTDEEIQENYFNKEELIVATVEEEKQEESHRLTLDSLRTLDKKEDAIQEKVHTGLFETEVIIPEKKNNEKKTNNIVSQYFDAERGQEVINKEHSSLVIREKPAVEEDYVLEKDLIAHENPYNKLFDKEARDGRNTVVEEISGKDKFASYNIKHIEQILHDSRSMESKNDKIRIEQLWKLMTRGARPEYLSIMETLQEGKIAVVGNKEFILVFPDVALCNQVMRAKFKDIAIRILYSLLGDTYNYVALPIDVWTAKSIEYKQQYQIGIKYPTLTPLNIKGLEVISDEEEYKNDSEKAINQTLRMFGKDNVKFE